MRRLTYPVTVPPFRRDGAENGRGVRGLYRFIWRVSRTDQLILCLITLVIIPVSTLPLELQRRITNEAIGGDDLHLLLVYGGLYLVVMVLQGWLKYALNMRRGRVVETVTLDLRQRIQAATLAGQGASAHERGTLVSMVAAEAEGVAGFVAESLSTPLLQGGTIVAVLGYLVWMQPLIASLAIVLYLPELILVPLGQRILNRLGALHVRLVRALGDTVVGETDAASLGARRFPLLAWRALVVRMASYRIKYFLTFLGNFLDAAGPLGVLVVGGWLVLQGQTTLGTLVVFITGFQKVGDPTDQLMTFYRTAQNARVRYDLLMDAVSTRLNGRA
ncbi:MAG: hypothetical protein U1E14_05340 [Geminicoccaceae bacterium]